MDRSFQDEAQRLQEYRRSLELQSRQATLTNTTIRAAPVSIRTGNERRGQEGSGLSGIESEPVQDPMIFPGLYSPSGFDMMGILVRVRMRPNPVIDIGNIDSSVALVLCDSSLPDTPVVYCSEAFEILTGYSTPEILGRNCRFLQQYAAAGISQSSQQDVNAEARLKLRESFSRGGEAQVRLVNYRKSGEKFINLLTTIPIAWDDEGDGNFGPGKRYIVGFQADTQTAFVSG